MKIRWKILLIMLSFSLLPMISMRWGGSRSIRNLGIELSGRTAETLFRQSTIALKRLVEDHARILKRDGELVKTVLKVQAAEFEKRSVNPLYINPRPDGIDAELKEQGISSVYCRQKNRSGKCIPLQISREKLSFQGFSGWNNDRLTEWKNRFSSLIDVYNGLNYEPGRGDLFLWQLTVLDNGFQFLYPSVQEANVPDYRASKWYRAAIGKEGIIWHPPGIDPLTKKLVWPVSAPVHDAEGRASGVTVVMLPVSALLHENEHIRMISRHVTSLLVVPEKRPDTGHMGIRIIADEETEWKKHRWRYLSSSRWLSSGTPGELLPIITDLLERRSDVREMPYKGEASVMAYSVVVAGSGVTLMLIVPKKDLIAEAIDMKQHVQKRFTEEIKTTGLLLTIIMVAVMLVALMLSRYITRNVNKLADAAKRLATGDFSSRVDVNTRDEIGELGHAFNQMVPDLEERIRMKQGLALARSVQQGLLPRKPPEISGFDIAAQNINCDETGGDFYDFIPIRRENIEGVGIAVGDVSGHGVSAALLMATARAFLKSRLVQPGALPEIIGDVNRLVCSDTEETAQFLTLFYLELFPGSDALSWVRAGHDPALLYDPEADCFSKMMGKGTALGVDETLSFSSNRLDNLTPDSIILIGTDGIWEARNEAGDMFGKESLKELIRSHARETAQEIASAVTDALRAFRGRKSFEDDITLVVVKRVR